MAESFTNALGRAVGVVTTATGGSIGIQTNKVTGISTTGIGVSAIVDNQHYIAGTKVLNFGTAAQEVVFDRDSTNTAAATNQILKFLGVTTSYTSTVGEKAILIGARDGGNFKKVLLEPSGRISSLRELENNAKNILSRPIDVSTTYGT